MKLITFPASIGYCVNELILSLITLDIVSHLFSSAVQGSGPLFAVNMHASAL